MKTAIYNQQQVNQSYFMKATECDTFISQITPASQLGMLIPVFLQTKFWLLQTGFKPVFDFTGLHRNLNFKPN